MITMIFIDEKEKRRSNNYKDHKGSWKLWEKLVWKADEVSSALYAKTHTSVRLGKLVYGCS